MFICYNFNMRDKIVTSLAFIIGAEALLVIAGWILGIDALTRILPVGINMKFPTALSFLLSAFGLYFIFRTIKDNYELSQVILVGIATAIFMLMGAIFVSYFSKAFTGLDSLFVMGNSPVYGAGSGLPALNSMIGFILFGLACVFALFFGPTLLIRIKFIGYPILILGAASLFGYALGLPYLYFQFNDTMTPMASNTALLFVLLGWGLIVTSQIKTTDEA